MKKRLLSIALLLTVCFCSCDANNYICVDGIENFKTVQSNYELNNYILPSDDYLEQFEFLTAEYHYREIYESWASIIGVEKSIVTVIYSPEVYNKAKEYCLQEMQLDHLNTIDYNGYTFIENIHLTVAQDRYGEINGFPRWFNMFIYNDTKHCLLFIGYYNSDYTSGDAQAVSENWGQFLIDAFGDVYIFDVE